MKTLKELSIENKQLKEAVMLLNASGLLEKEIKTVAVKGEVMLVNFLAGIDSIPEAKTKKIPGEVSKFYNRLGDEVFSEVDAANAETAAVAKKEEEVTSDCPVFKKGHDPKQKDCIDCKENTPLEYKVCKKAVGELKEKGAAKAKATVARTDGKKTRYGHAPGSMGGDIDDMVWKGSTKEKLINMLVDRHGRDTAKAEAKLKGHLQWLKADRGITVTVTEGKYQADKEFADGFTAENTTKSYVKPAETKAAE